MKWALHGLRQIAVSLALVGVGALAAGADPVLDAVKEIEADLGARVGFHMRDTATGVETTYAADDPFPLNSTFKVLACGALLAQVETGAIALTDRVDLSRVTVVSYSPAINTARAAGTREITLDQACRMVLSVSDNTAANIVLSQIGGPAGLTAFLRSIGDEVTRLDRTEPAMNESRPGDPRDTTSPRAVATSLERLLLGDALTAQSRDILQDWLADHSVSGDLFRAALPDDWGIEDRSGAGGYGSRAIVAVLYPPNRAPLVAALYLTETPAPMKTRNAAIAHVGAAIVAQVQQAD